MRSKIAKLFFALWLTASSLSSEPAGNWLQLRKLNQSSQQQLSEVQRGYAAQAAPQTDNESQARWILNDQQKRQQQALQMQQWQKQMMFNRRERVSPSASDGHSRPRSLFQYQQFQQQQRNQLSRFRTQQQLRLR